MEEENKNFKVHWEKAYTGTDGTKLGWYQDEAKPSMRLIAKTNAAKDTLIADIGSGSSILIDNLIESGYSNLLATDISQNALEITKSRIKSEDLSKIQWVVDDLTSPIALNKIDAVSVWHDRAVFHFLTKEEDQKTYLALLKSSVKRGGHVIIATFNLLGAERCSGLPVERYDEAKLGAFMGEGFDLLESFNYDYTMPSGAMRPYVYTLFQKQ